MRRIVFSIYRRLIPGGLRADLSHGIEKLGRAVAGSWYDGNAESAKLDDADVNAVQAFLSGELPPTIESNRDGWQGARTVRDVIACVDRIALADALVANDLRRALGMKWFAPLADRTGSRAWLSSTMKAVRIVGSPCGDDLAEVITAVDQGGTHILTSSLQAGYFSAVADIPTVVEFAAPVAENESPVLREFTRLPALAAVVVSTEALKQQMLKLAPALGNKIMVSPAGGASSMAALSRGEAASWTDAGIDGGGQRGGGDLLGESSASANAIEEAARPKILWLYGSEEQTAWAYGINAQRLAGRLANYQHFMGAKSKREARRFDIKISFDLLVARRRSTYRIRAKKSVVRVGGPNPLKEVAGGNRDRLADYLADVDGVIVLSPELKKMISELHPRVFFIPNGIDLDEWNPGALPARDSDRPFRAGMAASLRQKAEQDLKGYQLAVEACEMVGMPLLAVGRGMTHLPHDRMIEDFYSQIDVLIHATGPGKEACSNVVMESLALGIPVITTRYAGMHGSLLEHGREAMIVPRFSLSLAAALKELRGSTALRQTMAAAGRRFAERVHDLDAVARQYERVFNTVLGKQQP
jgi:glycosyltransferase involved in cell wall biosynthesis